MTRTTIRSEDITAGQVKSADIASGAIPETDLTPLETDIALLGFKVAANGSMAAYNLKDQFIDAFQDASGVDASASTDEVRNASDYYSGVFSVTVDNTYSPAGTDYSYTVPSGITSLSFKIWGGGGGGCASGQSGGAGGYVAGDLAVSADDVLKIAVSQATSGGGGSSTGQGGGYSGIFLGTHTHANAQAIAGGGGGGGTYRGGKGGDHDTNGQGGDGAWGANGTGGTLTAGGISGTIQGNGAGKLNTATSGSALQGGLGAAGTQLSPATYPGGGRGASRSGYSHATGGGGGGYYGGGGADWVSTYGCGGGGGSGFMHSTNVTNKVGMVGPDSAGTAPNTSDSDYTGQTAKGGCSNSSSNEGGGGLVVLSGSGSGANNMTLVSNSTTADSVPTTGDIVMAYTNGAGTATVNTDIKAYVSRDDGTTWTQATLSSEGTTGGHTILTAHNVDISSQPSGTSMRYKIETLNQSVSKETRIQAVSLGWS